MPLTGKNDNTEKGQKAVKTGEYEFIAAECKH